MIAGEANVVLLQLDGPEWGIQLAVLIFSVSVHATYHCQESNDNYDDGCQDNDVELVPRDRSHCGGGGGVVEGGAAQAAQQSCGEGGELCCSIGAGVHGGVVKPVGSG